MIKEFNPVEVNKQGKIYVETFEQIKLIHEKDNRKNQWAKEHNIPLIRIPYTLKDVHLRDLVPKTSKYVQAS